MAAPSDVPKPAAYALATLRIALGLTFLWAFLDKLFGLTYTTTAANSWLQGGHPTKGYLGSSFGPLGSMFQGMAGNMIVDALFMLGLLGVGIALTFGVATRLGGWGGVAMVLLMYVSHPVPLATPHTTHPFLDDHILDAAGLALVALTTSGNTWGMGRWWLTKTAKITWLH